MAVYYYETEIGVIGIREVDGFITNLYFKKMNIEDEIIETPLIKKGEIQLKEYLKGEIKYFNLPLKVEGSSFFNDVINVLKEIPYGDFITYKEVAIKIKKPKACRAVGLACNKNPLPIFIPCHRVIGSNGKITGYNGGITIKEKLLKLEGNLNF